MLLHGPPFDHRLWAPVIPYLAGRFRVVALDVPALDGPVAAVNLSPDQLVRTAAGFATAAQIVPCAVAGASLGGAVALGLAARYPERVSALVLVGSAGLEWWPQTPQARFARWARRVPGLLDAVMRLAPQPRAHALLSSVLADDSAIDGTLVGQVASVFRSASGRRALIQTLRQLDGWERLRRQVGAVRAPALLAWGERDEAYPLPTAERLRHAISGARLVTLAGAGHLLTVERPVELAALMRNFLLEPRR
jgi:pimeloyl-ACP methyl ester carboxylesterase